MHAWMHDIADTLGSSTYRIHLTRLFLLAVLFSFLANASTMRQSTAFLSLVRCRMSLALHVPAHVHRRITRPSVIGRRAFSVFKPFSDDTGDHSGSKVQAGQADGRAMLDWLSNADLSEVSAPPATFERMKKELLNNNHNHNHNHNKHERKNKNSHERNARSTAGRDKPGLKRDGNRGRKPESSGKFKMQQEQKYTSQKLQARDRLKKEMAEQDPYFRLRGVLDYNPHMCPGCGSPYQSKDEHAPGFLPKEKMQEQVVNAAEFKEHREKAKILELAGVDVSSPEGRELLKTAGMNDEQIASFLFTIGHYGESATVKRDTSHRAPSSTTARTIENFMQTDSFQQLSAYHDSEQLLSVDNHAVDGTEAMELAQEATLPSYEHEHIHDHHAHSHGTEVKDYGIGTICQRCHKLQHQSSVQDSLRPGWSGHEFLTPQRFVRLLESVKEKKCVVLLLVDLFDLQGSILQNVREVAGDNEVIVAANKVDLLPKDASRERVTAYVHQLVKSECGFSSPRTAADLRYDRASGRPKYHNEDPDAVLPRANVHLVSCKSGAGFDDLIRNVMTRARHVGGLVYVLGTANVGKSTFINQMLAKAYEGKSKRRTPAATVSSLPGTTLDMLKITLPTGVIVYDTPGIINPNQLTTKLTFEELKAVMPSKPLKPVTLRVSEGKCVCIGGLAKVELAEGKPFFLTFFVSPEVKLHMTSSEQADAFLDTHAGTHVSPPFTVERRQQLSLNQSMEFEVAGEGWQTASKDIVIAGLGWVSVTGAGSCKIRVSVPEGTHVDTRDALMPFDTWAHMSVYTGHTVKKTAAPKPTKPQKSSSRL